MKSIFPSAACFLVGCAVALVADDQKPEAELTPEVAARRFFRAWDSVVSSTEKKMDGHDLWVFYDARADRLIKIDHSPDCRKCKPKFD